jgi:hypothetical protein
MLKRLWLRTLLAMTLWALMVSVAVLLGWL